MRRITILLLLCLMLVAGGCGSTQSEPVADNTDAASETTAAPGAGEATEQAATDNGVAAEPADAEADADTDSTKNRTISITVGDTVLKATLEDNESARAFADMMPLTIRMSGYGGFEQVGSLGESLPAEDVSMETEPGDIVLYNTDSVVLFYGSNSWDYTMLGHIEGKSAGELEAILGSGDIEVNFRAE